MIKFLPVVKKEFTDHITDDSFLAIYLVMLILTLFSFYSIGETYNQWVEYMSIEVEKGQSTYDIESPYLAPITFLAVYEIVLPVLSLIALVMSFKTINSELNNGSLKVSLSYPIYRDQLFIGKMIGGVFTLSLVIFSVFILGFAELIYITGIPLVMDFLIRIGIFILSLILYVSVFFLLGAFFSVLFDNPLISFLVSILFYVFIVDDYLYYSMFQSFLYLIFGFTDYRMLHRFELAGYPIPSESYAFYSKNEEIFHSLNIKNNLFTIINEIFDVVSVTGWIDDEGITHNVISTIPLNNTLPQLINPFMILVISIIILFILNYLAFRRKDIV